MEFGLLGPLSVVSGSDDLVLGGPRQRTVLAHLLLRANHELTGDQLVDRVWGDHPPATARGSLHAYVSRLRSVLGPDRLEGRGGRYVLHAAPGEVDATRFDVLRAEARRFAVTDPESASRCLREALALWRGGALEDLAAEPSLAAAVARLDDERLAATEEWVELELSLARPEAVLAVLDDLVREHPYRERMWGQLVLALYRLGRQQDALDAYARLRVVLADELGLDPGPDLRLLHDQVVRQDPALNQAGRPLRGYRLVEQVGQGSFGVVYRAVQPETGREVAIKVIRSGRANAPDFVRRFDAEAETAARLQHPHVVPLHDYWREPDGAYLVMRHMRGGNLLTALNGGALGEDRVLRLVDQVALALDFAHKEGVVHRDVKPANILFDEDGNAYLSDFGIAREVRDVDPAEVLASPLRAYRSPEAARGAPVDARTDVYSLGVVAREALTAGRSDEDLHAGVAEVIARATATEPDLRPATVLELADDLRRAVGSAPSGDSRAPDVPVRNPYKGLRPFSGADSEDFHGRCRLVSDLVDRFSRDDRIGRFVVVVGPSGSGKSSVVAAGLVPALRAGAVPGSQHWFIAEMHPGSRPFDELAVALHAVSASARSGVADHLRWGAALAQVVAAVLPDPSAHLVLVLDQLEEVFTLADPDERDAFLRMVAAAVADPEGRVRVIASLRADFYDLPLANPDVAELVSAATVAVTPLAPDELERAIVAPAEAVGVRVEAALTAALVAHVSNQPASLPLLQYALTELFDQRDDDCLRLKAYERLGGVSAVLARRAEELFARLTPAGREAARQLFLHLITLGDEAAPATRRRATRAGLAALDVHQEAMEEAIDAFGAKRLLTFDHDPVTRGPTVEVAHEALLREWDRLRAWVDQARGDVALAGRLRAAAREWQESGREESVLLRGDRLRRFETWAHSSLVAVGRDERAFLAASVARRDAEERAEEERAARERGLEQRSLVRLRVALAVVVVFAVVATLLTLVALDRGRDAADEARTSRARELAAAAAAALDRDPELSTLLALEAVAATRDHDGTVLREAEEALRRSVQAVRLLRSFPQGGGGLALVDGGRRVVTAGHAGEAGPQVWDLDTGDPVADLAAVEDAISGSEYVAESPDGRLLAFHGNDREVLVVDARTGDLERVWVGRNPGMVAFSPDGRLMAGVDGRSILLWRVRDGHRVATLPGDGSGLVSVAFRPDGRHLAAGADSGRIMVWDARSGALLQRVRGHEWPVRAVAYSADGRWLASAGYDARVAIRNARTGRLRNTITSGTPFEDVTFSPDGRTVLTAGTDSVATLWRADTGQQLIRLAGHGSGVVTDAVFLPDGQRVLTSSADGTTRLWDVSTGGAREWLTVPGVRQIYAGVTFSPDGSVFAAPSHPTGVTVWDADTGREVITLSGTTEKLTSLVFSPDGSKLVAGSDALSEPPVWDVRTGDLLFRLVGHRDSVRAVAFSPDGERIVTSGDSDGRILEWDASTGEPTGKSAITVNSSVYALAYAPDGRLVVGEWNTLVVRDSETLQFEQKLEGHTDLISGIAFDGSRVVTASFDGTARVWNLGDRRELLVFRGHRGPVNLAAYSPDGAVVATTGEDGTTRLWDPETGEERLTLFGHTSLVYGVAFSPDGRLLATASPDGTVVLRLMRVEELVSLAKSRLTRDFTPEECETYLHRSTCA